MSEYTALASYLASLDAQKASLENIDVDALVEQKIDETRAKVRQEITDELDNEKNTVNIKIEAIFEAMDFVEKTIVQAQEKVTDEVPTEYISDESY